MLPEWTFRNRDAPVRDQLAQSGVGEVTATGSV